MFLRVRSSTFKLTDQYSWNVVWELSQYKLKDWNYEHETLYEDSLHSSKYVLQTVPPKRHWLSARHHLGMSMIQYCSYPRLFLPCFSLSRCYFCHKIIQHSRGPIRPSGSFIYVATIGWQMSMTHRCKKNRYHDGCRLYAVPPNSSSQHFESMPNLICN